MRPALIALTCLALCACGGESRGQDHPPTASIEEADRWPPPATPAPAPTQGAAPEDTPAPVTEDAPDPFAGPLPSAPCPDVVHVAIAHESAAELPTWLDRAVAFRSEDGRRVRIAIANHPLDLDDIGRFAAPAPGEARFEMDATRTRRGPLTARVLGRPDARSGGLSHARIVSAGALLTFGARDIGQIEITAIDETRVCGRIELGDGFGRVRGAFAAPFVGPMPE